MASATRTVRDRVSGALRTMAKRRPFVRFAKSPPLLAGMLVFTMAFGLYAATTAQSLGYDPETAAVSEGLVARGSPRIIEYSPLRSGGTRGRGGHLYGRTGFLQPVLEAPFYAAGWAWDAISNDSRSPDHRQLVLSFYNPFVAALAAVALFAFVLLARGSLQWAIAITALFTVASVAWPYSKIGMETTVMFVIITAFALAAWARHHPHPMPWVLAGSVAGAAVATRGYALIVPAAVAVLLYPAIRDLPARQQLRLGLPFLVPIVVWVVAEGWFNWWRFGSVVRFSTPTGGDIPWQLPVALAAAAVAIAGVLLYRREREFFWPIAVAVVTAGLAFAGDALIGAAGLLVSPGKGLIFYSPLVVAGVFGFPRMWRQDPWLAASLVLLVVTLIGLAGSSSYWGDEAWGPRYLVPVAWIPLVPIAWWATTRLRQRVVVGVALVAVLIQVVGVYDRYDRYYAIAKGLTGVTPYAPRVEHTKPQRIPFGNDPPRWIPEVSPLLLGAEGLISSMAVEPLTGDGLKVTYAPFEGRRRTIDLSVPRFESQPYFWWHYRGTKSKLGAVALFAAAVASGIALLRLARRYP